ncbi:hypothetical protein PO909_015239 [Leuciscus waleckii]
MLSDGRFIPQCETDREKLALKRMEKLVVGQRRQPPAAGSITGQARAPHGSGPASVEAAQRLSLWGSQKDLADENETATALSHSSSEDPEVPAHGAEARAAASSARDQGPMLELSASEEVDVLSIEADDHERNSPVHGNAYEELIEVVTRAVARLNIRWPQDEQGTQVKSKLDERFLQHRSQPQRRGLPFFPDLHKEISRSWEKPHSSRVYNPAVVDYSNVLGARDMGYGKMPKVEEALAGYLSPEAASSLKAPALPSKPCRDTSALVGRAYMAAGRAGSCLHSMAILQAYQADLLKDFDEGEGPTPEDIAELRKATDLSLRATKETARAIGRSMAAMVATERHLWLNLSGIKEKDKSFLLDAPLSSSGLFGDAVASVVDRFQETKKQSSAFQQFLPRRSKPKSSRVGQRDQPQPSSSSSYRQEQKESVASRAPPSGAWQQRKRSQQKSSGQKGDLRDVLQARRASGKRS